MSPTHAWFATIVAEDGGKERGGEEVGELHSEHRQSSPHLKEFLAVIAEA